MSIERLGTQSTHKFTRVPSEMEDGMFISLKCCDEETGQCASNPTSRQGEELNDLEEPVVGWCRSSVWVPSRHKSSRVPYVAENDMYISLKCCDEETGKCASNPMSKQMRRSMALENL